MGTNTAAASSNQTAEKLLQVMEALAYQSQPVKLGDLAKQLGMNNSTLYRFLSALQNMGYLNQNEGDGRYALNLKLCYLGEMVRRGQSIVTLLHHAVVEASTLFQETAHLTQIADERIVYVDNVTVASQSLTIRQYIGKTAPMHCTGAGKLFLSGFSEEQLAAYLAAHPLRAMTPYTITTREGLLQELEAVRQQGYALDNEECELGMRCAAAPVRDYTGQVTACVSVSAPAARLTDEVIRRKIHSLMEIAQRASGELWYQGKCQND